MWSGCAGLLGWRVAECLACAALWPTVTVSLLACLVAWLPGLPATGYRGDLAVLPCCRAAADVPWCRHKESARATKQERAREGWLSWLGLACWVGVVWLVVMGDGGSDG